jgi:arylsulfatase A-like enzyme
VTARPVRDTQASIVGRSVAGGALAAAVVGLGESAVVAVERGLGIDPGLLHFALLWYGLVGVGVGVAAGAGLAVAGRVVGRRVPGAAAFALTGAATLALLATVIGRFRVFRDVLHESFEGAPLSPLAFQLASLALALALFAAVFLALRAAAARRSWIASPALVLGALALASGGAWAAAVAIAPAPPAVKRAGGPAPVGPSVLLVMVDTLRADHLSCYGYERSRTPAIDGLAADGTRFARAYAQASWTRPSVATIFTSLYPSSHRAVHKSDVLSDEVVTLAEVMQASGYATVGFANNVNVAPLFNFQQGFDEYTFLEPAFFFGASEAAAQLTIYNQLRLVRERYLSQAKYVENYYQPAEVVTRRALDWIAAHDERPFFMFLHYMEPHDPYFAHPFDGRAFARVADPNPPPAMAGAYRDAYDGEIRYLDAQLARLLDELRSRGLYDRSLIVLTSDHGEEFHEHGGWWHGLTLYEEQIAVPLIVKPPRGGAAGAVNDGLVSSLDIAPTVLAVAGVPIPETMQGKPLGLAAGAPAPRDHVFAEQDLEGNILQAYQHDGWKLIDANPGNPRGLPARQLFELGRDPGERQDLAAARAERAERLATDMAAVRSHAEAVAVDAGETTIDAATEERLRALGYVH